MKTLTDNQKATLISARWIIEAQEEREQEPVECLAEIVDAHLSALRKIKASGVGRLTVELTMIRNKLEET